MAHEDKYKKTNKKYLSLVAMVGIMGAALIGLGAGCADVAGYDEVLNSEVQVPSVAELREKLVEKVEKEKEKALAIKDEEAESRMSTFTEGSFAEFTVDYPSLWTVDHWRGGVSMKSDETGEFVSIFEQIVGHPEAGLERRNVVVDGVQSVRYDEVSDGGASVHIIEIPYNDKILEISGNLNVELFDEIISSFRFQDSQSLPDRDLNHWDIRDGRVCIQKITYARKSESEQCQVFSTPCDVPEYWEVCDDN